jgi:hypothetical protein
MRLQGEGSNVALSDKEIVEINKERLQAGHRERAEEFAAQKALEDADWQSAINAFVQKHSGATAIRNDSLLVCKDANVHLILVTAKALNLRPSVAALETAWLECKDKLCDKLEDRLGQDDKDRIVTNYLCRRRGLDSALPWSKLKKHFTQEDWDTAVVECGPQFRQLAVEKDYKPRLTGERIAPQVFKPSFAESPVCNSEEVRKLSYNDLITMKPERQMRLMKIPYAKEWFQGLIDRHHAGLKT